MKERPILFSGAMVRALLAGTKTQTRRAVKPQPPSIVDSVYRPFPAEPNNWQGYGDDAIHWYGRCPYGQPGDRLWVRETTRMRYLPNLLTGEPTNAECGEYVADGEPMLNEDGFDYAWWYSRKTCPGIHMPRWASRITLEVNAVRVERLQDISGDDCIAEGIEQPIAGVLLKGCTTAHAQRSAYRSLWESINGGGSWALNPWVWVVAFRRVNP